jgi:hypothetical protein
MLNLNVTLPNGTYVDPSEVVFTLREPDGVVTTLKYSLSQITKNATGQYSVTWDCAKVGYHKYSFQTSGSVVVCTNGGFEGVAAIT